MMSTSIRQHLLYTSTVPPRLRSLNDRRRDSASQEVPTEIINPDQSVYLGYQRDAGTGDGADSAPDSVVPSGHFIVYYEPEGGLDEGALSPLRIYYALQLANLLCIAIFDLGGAGQLDSNRAAIGDVVYHTALAIAGVIGFRLRNNRVTSIIFALYVVDFLLLGVRIEDPVEIVRLIPCCAVVFWTYHLRAKLMRSWFSFARY